MMQTVRQAGRLGLIALILIASDVLPAGRPRIAEAAGDRTVHAVKVARLVGGRMLETEVLIGLRPGADPNVAASKVRQKVAPGSSVSDQFLVMSSVYAQFFDRRRRNNVVTQYYNPAGDPTGGGLVALKNAQRTWSSVRGSTFNLAYGGTTTRCPSLSIDCPGGQQSLDGFNDVGWRSLAWDQPPEFVVYGHAVVAADYSTGETLETDVILNSDIAPYAWYTDGVEREGFFDVDVETLVLHELGHVAGLAHSFDPTTVMVPAILFVRRELTEAERDGLAFLYPRRPSTLVESSSAHNFSLVAEVGAPAPGGGTYLSHFEPGGINDHGDVIFVSDAPNGQALFVSHRDEVARVAYPGLAVGSTRLGLLPFSPTAINDARTIAYTWMLDPTLPDPFIGQNVGLYRARHNAAIEELVRPGVTAAPGGGTFIGASGTDLSNDDEVAFAGLVDSEFGPQFGSFVARRNGSLAAIARPGDQLPSGKLRTSNVPSISSNGRHIAFAGTLNGATGETAYLRRGVGGALDRIAGPGDQVPGGGVLLSAQKPQVNNRGDVLFGGRVQRGDQPPTTWMFLASRGSLEIVAREGDRMPDGWRFSGLAAGLNSWSLNDAGDVVFLANTRTDPVRDYNGVFNSFFGTAVYASTGGQLRYVVRTNAIIFGLGGVYAMVGLGPVINGRGDVVFLAQTDGGRIVLVKAGPRVYTPR